MLKRKRIIAAIIVLIMLIMGLEMFVPKNLAADLNGKEVWVDTNFGDESGDTAGDSKLIDTIVFEDKLYVASTIYEQLDDDTVSNKITVKSYNGEAWEKVGEPLVFDTQSPIEQIAFCKQESNLYIFYSGVDFFEIKKLNLSVVGSWEEVVELTNVTAGFGFAVGTDVIYITLIDRDETTARIYDFDGTNLLEEKVYFEENGYIVEPKATILDDILYVGVREVGKLQITVYSYENGEIVDLNSPVVASSYTMSTLREKIYITTDSIGDNGLVIYTYDGNEWGTIDTEVNYGSPSMVIKENEVYILTSAWVTDGKLRTYSYSKSTQQFVQEGEDVDEPALTAQAIIYNDYIYTIYQNGTSGEIMAKRKEFVLDYFRGDINLDNRISVADAIMGSKGLTGKVTLTDEQKAIGDVNDDGRFSVADLIKIAKLLTGKIEVL